MKNLEENNTNFEIGQVIKNSKSENHGVVVSVSDDTVTVRRLDNLKPAKWKAANCEAIPDNYTARYVNDKGSAAVTGSKAEIAKKLKYADKAYLLDSLDVRIAGTDIIVFSVRHGHGVNNPDFFSNAQLQEIISEHTWVPESEPETVISPEPETVTDADPYLMMPILPDTDSDPEEDTGTNPPPAPCAPAIQKIPKMEPYYDRETGQAFWPSEEFWDWCIEIQFLPVNESWLASLLHRSAISVCRHMGSGAGHILAFCRAGTSIPVEEVVKNFRIKPLLTDWKPRRLQKIMPFHIPAEGRIA